MLTMKIPYDETEIWKYFRLLKNTLSMDVKQLH